MHVYISPHPEHARLRVHRPKISESRRPCSRDGERKGKEKKRRNKTGVRSQVSDLQCERTCVCLRVFLCDWKINIYIWNKLPVDLFLPLCGVETVWRTRFFAHKHQFTTRTKQSGSFARESHPASHTHPNRQCWDVWQSEPILTGKSAGKSGEEGDRGRELLKRCPFTGSACVARRCGPVRACEYMCGHFRNRRLNTRASSSDH